MKCPNHPEIELAFLDDWSEYLGKPTHEACRECLRESPWSPSKCPRPDDVVVFAEIEEMKCPSCDGVRFDTMDIFGFTLTARCACGAEFTVKFPHHEMRLDLAENVIGTLACDKIYDVVVIGE